jgi:AmpD protein
MKNVLEIVEIPSPNFDARPPGTVVDLVVIHAISLPPGEFLTGRVVDFFTNRLDPEAHPFFREIADLKVSSHYFIDRSGRIIRFVAESDRAWHAGVSRFRGRENCNDFSLGIELEGDDFTPFEKAQYRSLNLLLKDLAARYPALSRERIVGHADIAPGRKTDPGPFFDWTRIEFPGALQTSSSQLSRLLIVGVDGAELSPAERTAFTRFPPGGVILFARNCADPEKTRALVADLQELSLAACGRPLLVTIDQEGGRVRRLKAGFPDFPGAEELGKRGDLAVIRETAAGMARALHSLGINCNLAPVADLQRQGSKVLSGRCFGADPEKVSAAVRAYIEGLQGEGVAACAKHFPGHGTVAGDSHKLLPVSELDADGLRKHLKPFGEAVAAGVELVMAAHLLFPAIDPQSVPFSRIFLVELARRQLGFSGLLLSDDLDMAAVSGRPLPEVMVAGLSAGLDLALWGRNLKPVADPAPTMAAFVEKLQNCALPAAEIAEKLARLERLAEKFSRPAAAGVGVRKDHG